MNPLPPGQVRTYRFPVVGERRPHPDPLDINTWRLTVDGDVEQPRYFRFDEIQILAKAEWTLDVHCVTGWSRLDMRWSGVPLHHILACVRPSPEARYVRFEAYSERHHDSSLPLAFAADHVLLAYECEGKPLTVEHGFPLRCVVRGKYFYKSVKWLRRIELMREDRLGYWEGKYFYHNHADPWREERHAV